ncbi:MAG: M64 family metallopeptidase, partial [Ignavibacteria bacterium]|nr:M64 family metallopeptidase [Ignavibacteria bacterium]
RTGVFEGGGYSAKGIYRPAHDCLMNSFKGNSFCDACNEAIIKMISFYSE